MVENLILLKDYGVFVEDGWQAYEAQYARNQGLYVDLPRFIPGFQEGGIPTVKAFQEFIVQRIKHIGVEPEKTVVLAHGLGGNGWLHVLNEHQEMRGCLSTLFGMTRTNQDELVRADAFFPTPDLKLSREERKRLLVVGSNDTIRELGGHLEVFSLTLPGAGKFKPRKNHQNNHEMDLGKEWMKLRQLFRNFHLPY